MKNALKALALAGAMAISTGAAQAATLSISDGLDVALLSAGSGTDGFSLYTETGLAANTVIQVFNSTNIAGNGLSLVGGDSPLKITYIGKEADATNLTFTAINTGDPVSGSANSTLQFNNQSTAVGSFFVINNLAGLVNFFFQTTGLDGSPDNTLLGDGIFSTSGTAIIRNGTGADDTRISLGLFQNQDGSVFAFFGDGRGDADYDDMVLRIEVVPLPAGGLLLLTALGGIAVMRRRKAA